MKPVCLLLALVASVVNGLGVITLSYNYLVPTYTCNSDAMLTVSYLTNNSTTPVTSMLNLTFPSGVLTILDNTDAAVTESWFNLTIDNTANVDPLCTIDISVNETSAASSNSLQTISYFKQLETMSFQLVINDLTASNLSIGSGWITPTSTLTAGARNVRVVMDAVSQATCFSTWNLQSLSVLLGTANSTGAPSSVFSTIFNDYTYFVSMKGKSSCNPSFAVLYYNTSGAVSAVYDSINSNWNKSVMVYFSIVGGQFVPPVNVSVDAKSVSTPAQNLVDLQIQGWFIAPLNSSGTFSCSADQLQASVIQGSNMRNASSHNYGFSFFQPGFQVLPTDQNITLSLSNLNTHPKCTVQVLVTSLGETTGITQSYFRYVYPGETDVLSITYDNETNFIGDSGWKFFEDDGFFFPSLKLNLQSVSNSSAVTYRAYCGTQLLYTGNADNSATDNYLTKDMVASCAGHWYFFVDVTSGTPPQFSLSLHNNNLPQPVAVLVADSGDSKSYSKQFVVQFDLSQGSQNVSNVNVAVDSNLAAPTITSSPTTAPTSKTTSLSKTTVNYIVGIVVGVVGTVILVVVGMLVWLRIRQRKQGYWNAPIGKTSRDGFDLPLVNKK
jgi:hypothetical protein